MTDLRTAAQQALEALQWHYRQGHSNTLGGFRLKIDEKALRELRAALEQQDEPVEPVAWVKEDVCDGQYIDGRPRKIWWECNKGVGTAFYTTPPQRTMAPLTEDEIYHATGHCGVSRYTAIKIIRAVEKASWEKNHGQA